MTNDWAELRRLAEAVVRDLPLSLSGDADEARANACYKFARATDPATVIALCDEVANLTHDIGEALDGLTAEVEARVVAEFERDRLAARVGVLEAAMRGIANADEHPVPFGGEGPQWRDAMRTVRAALSAPAAQEDAS